MNASQENIKTSSLARDRIDCFVTWALRAHASARSSAFIRILFPMVIWSHWQEELRSIYAADGVRFVALLALHFAGVLFFVGALTRGSGLVFAAAINYLAWSSHSDYGQDIFLYTRLLGYLAILVALLPSGKSFSVDRWLEIRRAKSRNSLPQTEIANICILRFIALSVAAVHGWLGAEFVVTKTHSLAQSFGDLLLGLGTSNFVIQAILFSIGVLNFAIAIGLLMPRVRCVFLPIGVLFWILVCITLPFQALGAVMLICYIAFLDPNAVHRRISATTSHSS